MTLRLELDPIACDGHGLCADLLPELIELDEWGFPMIDAGVPAGLAGHARRAVSACPALALKLSRVPAKRTAGGFGLNEIAAGSRHRDQHVPHGHAHRDLTAGG